MSKNKAVIITKESVITIASNRIEALEELIHTCELSGMLTEELAKWLENSEKAWKNLIEV